MNNLYKNVRFGGTAIAVLIATSFATAYGQGNGNNQPSGQGATQTPANVVVTNTSAQPVPTKEQNNPDLQQPFDFTGPFNILAGSTYAQIQLPPVPAGKRLIIQQVSALAYVQGGSGVITSVKLDIFNGAKYIPTFIPMTYVGAGDFMPSSVYTTLQQVRTVMDPNAQPSYLWVTKSKDINYGNSGTVVGDFEIHGYLVNIP
jgi:hypothetical protein